jgi:hypothetical protein
MINQNLKTQVQSRIDAATGATTLDDLLLIRKAAVGLGCNESNLDSLIAAKITALGGASLPIELVGANASLGLNGRITYQTPIAVDSGDQLYIDAIGVVKKQKHPLTAVVQATLANSNGVSAIDMLLGFSGVFVPGRLSSCRELFDFVLSDGNRMVGVNHTPSSSNYGVQIYVMTPDRQAILWTGHIPVLPAGYEGFYVKSLGLFEFSANTFRLYFCAPATGNTATDKVLFHSLAYNTGTNAVSGAAGSLVFTGTAAQEITAQTATRQGERYVALASGAQIATLDMQASSVTVHTGLAGGSASAFDHADPANVFTRAVSGSTIKIIKAGVATPIDLPANLIADGCFGSAWTTALIGAGMWIARNGTTGQLKLVKFNTAYTTATIYSLGTASGSGSSAQHFCATDGSRFWIRFGGQVPIIHFKWSGLSAPTEFTADCDETTLHRVPRFASSTSMMRVITPSDKAIAFGAPYTAYSVNVIQSGIIMTFDPAELLHYDSKLLGTAITSGAAASLVELELSPGLRYDHREIGNKHNTRQHQGVRVTFGSVPVTTGPSVVATTTSNTAVPASSVPFGAVVQFDPCELYATVGEYTSGEAGFWFTYSAGGLVRGNTYLDLTCRKPFIAVFFGNSPIIRKEVQL